VAACRNGRDPYRMASGVFKRLGGPECTLTQPAHFLAPRTHPADGRARVPREGARLQGASSLDRAPRRLLRREGDTFTSGAPRKRANRGHSRRYRHPFTSGTPRKRAVRVRSPRYPHPFASGAPRKRANRVHSRRCRHPFASGAPRKRANRGHPRRCRHPFASGAPRKRASRGSSTEVPASLREVTTEIRKGNRDLSGFVAEVGGNIRAGAPPRGEHAGGVPDGRRRALSKKGHAPSLFSSRDGRSGIERRMSR
jgi:hypothetical protein